MKIWSSRLQRPGVGALLQVRPVAAVLRGDLARRPRPSPTTRGRLISCSACSRVTVSRLIEANSDPVRGLALAVLVVDHLGDVGPVAAVAGHDHPAGLRVDAELALLTHRLGQQLPGQLDGELVRRQVVGHVGPPALLVLDVGAVATDPDHDRVVGRRLQVTDREGGQLAGVDLAQLGDQPLQPLPVAVAAEVEVGQHRDPLGVAAGDLVQHLLHLGGERVVDQLGEVLLQQPGDREGQPGRHQRRALLEHVVAAGDGADDRGVRRGPADLQLLQLGHQRRLGVAGRRPGLVAGRR